MNALEAHRPGNAGQARQQGNNTGAMTYVNLGTDHNINIRFYMDTRKIRRQLVCKYLLQTYSSPQMRIKPAADIPHECMW